MLCNVSSPWQGRCRSGNDLFQRNKFKASARLPDILAENFSLFSSASPGTTLQQKGCMLTQARPKVRVTCLHTKCNKLMFQILGAKKEKRDLARYDLH
jgi:hypothetical protein